MEQIQNLWRGSLLPLDGEAVPTSANSHWDQVYQMAAASQPSGSKLPRHKKLRHIVDFR
jgi:hypothetical protein